MLKFRAFVVVLLMALSSCLASGEEEASNKGSNSLVCEQEPIELGIVLDSSSSIQESDFNKGIDFLQDFLQQFNIGQENVRVSLISFGKGIYPENGFNLTDCHNKTALFDAISKIEHKSGPYTDTGLGIEYMHDTQMASDIVRPDAEKVGLVITDGNSQKWRFTEEAAAEARADKITMFAVGIGTSEQLREQELENIAGDPDRVTRVGNYSSLSSIKELLAKKTCIKSPKPVTMAPMKYQSCGEASPADINFVFSSGDLGLDARAWTTTFISHMVGARNMDKGFHYGLTTGICPEDAGFDLDTYGEAGDIKERLFDYDRDRLTLLTQKLLKEGFDSDHGGREGARKVAVLFAMGYQGVKSKDLQATVKELDERGIQVFIANPAGFPVRMNHAKGLQGRSSRQQAEELISWLCPQFNA